MVMGSRGIAVWALALGLLAAGLLAAGCQNPPPMEWLGQRSLFQGSHFAGWRALDANDNQWLIAEAVTPDQADPRKFALIPGSGIMVNGFDGRTCNLLTTQVHGDCRAHIEFVVPQGSNSGVYFQGMYEIQVLDSFGKEKVAFDDCGGVYARWIDNRNVDGHAPRVNASRLPGQWQSYDIWFKAPRFDEKGEKVGQAKFLKVVHNGTVIHENVELKGPTRASLPGPERPVGPLMLQGDHGPVAYRNIWIQAMDFSNE